MRVFEARHNFNSGSEHVLFTTYDGALKQLIIWMLQDVTDYNLEEQASTLAKNGNFEKWNIDFGVEIDHMYHIDEEVVVVVVVVNG